MSGSHPGRMLARVGTRGIIPIRENLPGSKDVSWSGFLLDQPGGAFHDGRFDCVGPASSACDPR